MNIELYLRRRALIKWAAALPLLGTIAVRGAFDKAVAAVAKGTAKDYENNIYTRIGVRPLINARGHWTYLGSTLELPEVRAATEEAAKYFVDMYELNDAVGKRLAEISGAEYGMITAGVAAAMAAATAACLAGTDPQKIWQLPDTSGMKSEVVMFGGRSAFDSAIRLAGAKLVLANTLDELKNAINEKTAMVYRRPDEELDQVLKITKKAGVPLFLDRAGAIPPIDAMKRYAKMGVDLYAFSGGKGLKGPMCSGIMLGRKDLIEAAMKNYSPNEGAICRPMKVGKEEVMGCLAAVEAWLTYDLDERYKNRRSQMERIKKLVQSVSGVAGEIFIPDGHSQPFLPWLKVDWNEEAFGLTVEQCWQKLREGTPRIEVLIDNNPSLVSAAREDVSEKSPKTGRSKRDRGPQAGKIRITSLNIEPGEDLIIGKRLRDILKQARKKAKRNA